MLDFWSKLIRRIQTRFSFLPKFTPNTMAQRADPPNMATNETANETERDSNETEMGSNETAKKLRNLFDTSLFKIKPIQSNTIDEMCKFEFMNRIPGGNVCVLLSSNTGVSSTFLFRLKRFLNREVCTTGICVIYAPPSRIPKYERNGLRIFGEKEYTEKFCTIRSKSDFATFAAYFFFSQSPKVAIVSQNLDFFKDLGDLCNFLNENQMLMFFCDAFDLPNPIVEQNVCKLLTCDTLFSWISCKTEPIIKDGIISYTNPKLTQILAERSATGKTFSMFLQERITIIFTL